MIARSGLQGSDLCPVVRGSVAGIGRFFRTGTAPADATTGASEKLGALREDIDEIDRDIADLVVERVETAEAVAAVKADADADLVDERREAAVKTRYEERFDEAGLDGENGRDLAATLIEIALCQERQVADSA